MEKKNTRIIEAIVLSAGIIISVIIFSIVWKSARTADQTITVTGSAKMNITADFGMLSGTLTVRNESAKYAFRNLNGNMPRVIKFLSKYGFKKDDIELFTINSYPIYRMNDKGYSTQQIQAYNYSQRIKIESDDVNKIKEISLAISSLVEDGVNFNVDPPKYLYTKLHQIKIDIQAKAAANAMLRAEKIAKATGRDLGPLRKARMGVIQITPRNSTSVSDYGFNDTSSIEKEITAVVNASFEIQ